MAQKRKIAIFASGNGSNFEAIARAAIGGEIEADVALLVCDKPTAKVVQIAQQLGIDSFVFSAKDYTSKQEFEQEIVNRCNEADVELICLAGYMRLVGETLLEAYEGRIINIHPSLLPAFKGKDAIKQAFEYGVKVYGCTIHYVDNSLDGGKIIAQSAIAYDGNNFDELEQKIHSAEHTLYINTIRELLN
ncbi:MAG: phosphoribosylglycinamide formyltransferase [Alistipes sp.]|nr:phosphoribosylglycinamide formyltransferase [Alistipes sp.]